MWLFEKILDKLTVLFSFKNNRWRSTKQVGDGLHLHQEPGGVSTIIQIEHLNVTNIEDLARVDLPISPEALIESAGRRFLIEQSIKQDNFKNAVSKADLGAIENPQQVGKDWFLRWMEVAQSVSKEDVQDLLAKVLSGEVSGIGNFSLRALDVLKNLTQSELAIFQRFCDVSFSYQGVEYEYVNVIADPYGSPGSNGMQSLGLSYANLTILQDAGLVQPDLTAWVEVPLPDFLQVPFSIGSTPLVLRPMQENVPSVRKIKVIAFTAAGRQLRSALKLGENPEYVSRFVEWAKNSWKMSPVETGEVR